MNPLLILQIIQGSALAAETIARILVIVREANAAGANIGVINAGSVATAEETLALIDSFRAAHPDV